MFVLCVQRGFAIDFQIALLNIRLRRADGSNESDVWFAVATIYARQEQPARQRSRQLCAESTYDMSPVTYRKDLCGAHVQIVHHTRFYFLSAKKVPLLWIMC